MDEFYTTYFPIFSHFIGSTLSEGLGDNPSNVRKYMTLIFGNSDILLFGEKFDEKNEENDNQPIHYGELFPEPEGDIIRLQIYNAYNARNTSAAGNNNYHPTDKNIKKSVLLKILKYLIIQFVNNINKITTMVSFIKDSSLYLLFINSVDKSQPFSTRINDKICPYYGYKIMDNVSESNSDIAMEKVYNIIYINNLYKLFENYKIDNCLYTGDLKSRNIDGMDVQYRNYRNKIISNHIDNLRKFDYFDFIYNSNEFIVINITYLNGNEIISNTYYKISDMLVNIKNNTNTIERRQRRGRA